jgi:lipoprotein-anchoring transpeptidase ErfK/SrfK
MPYWMRLSGTVFGVHAGHLPGYPASAGCVRLPVSAAEVIFDNTTYGTKVSIYSQWDGA